MWGRGGGGAPATVSPQLLTSALSHTCFPGRLLAKDWHSPDLLLLPTCLFSIPGLVYRKGWAPWTGTLSSISHSAWAAFGGRRWAEEGAPECSAK